MLLPELDLIPFENNLKRLSDEVQLYNSLNIMSGERLLYNKEFIRDENKTEKKPNYWLFSVCAVSHSFSGQGKAIFDEVKNDPEIKKIILSRSKPIEVEAVNTEVIPLRSRQAQDLLIQSGCLFINAPLSESIVYPINIKKHKIIYLNDESAADLVEKIKLEIVSLEEKG